MSEKVRELVIGKITTAHGLKGELRVLPYTESPEDFKKFKTVNIKGKTYEIVNARINKGKIILTVKGISDRNQAEALRNTDISISREQTDPTEEDEYLIADLLGCDVFNQDVQKIGVLTDVIQSSGAVNNFEIDLGEHKIYVPALKEYFQIDLEEKRIISNIPEEYYEL